MGARAPGRQLLCWPRAAGVTVTHEPFKLRDPGSIPGRPTSASMCTVWPGREHMFVHESDPWVPRAGRPEFTNRLRAVEMRRCPRHGMTDFGQYADKQALAGA